MTKCATYPQGACPPTMPTDIAGVNSALADKVVAPHSAAGHKVFLHDVNSDAQWVEHDYWTWGIHRSEAGFAKMAASWKKTILAHVVPPARSCRAALDYACGIAGVRGNATLCKQCLVRAKKQLEAAKCTQQEEQAICEQV